MRSKKEIIFICVSCLLSLLHAIGYIWLGIQEGFSICIYAMVFLDLFYIPVTVINNTKIFPYYLVLFSGALIFITAFTQSELFNNYSALLCLFVAILIKPRFKNIFMAFYLIVSASAFCVAGDPVYYLVIHFSRALWIFIIYDFVIYGLYNRKPVILFDEEILILEQMVDNKLQKEIELNGYSDRTIRRRLENAIKRNNCKDKDELKELYKTTYKK